MFPESTNDSACLYTLLHADAAHHDDLLTAFVAPIVRDCADAPELESWFFARYNLPEWQLRFRVLGEPAWIEDTVRPRVKRDLPAFRDGAHVTGWEFASYQREYERYGGPVGMRLAERLFHHDSDACLARLDVERRGAHERSRREFSLLYVERLLDRFRFSRARRIEFYRFAYSWTREQAVWGEGDAFRVLEERYAALRDGLAGLLVRDATDPEWSWGGAETAKLATTCLERSAPVADAILEAHAAGEIEQDLVHLAWSYAHMHTNRLGIDTHAEAVLRYFGHRMHEDEAIGVSVRGDLGRPPEDT